MARQKDGPRFDNNMDNDDVYDDSSATTGFGGFDFDQGADGLDGDLDDDLDDGGYTDDADLRRKLNRLAGPGGAMEAESREAPHLFSPGGPLESPEMARAVGGTGGGGGGGTFAVRWPCLRCAVAVV